MPHGHPADRHRAHAASVGHEGTGWPDVYAVIAPTASASVSTGATGNTPEGSFTIRTKYPSTTSGYGGVLFRTMGFYADFAIHGYSPVPPYPASHGCVRVPDPAIDWLWSSDLAPLGTTVVVY